MGSATSHTTQEQGIRNPKQVVPTYSGIVAPHALTVRWIYDVPAGRQAVVELLTCITQRATVASAAVLADNYIKLTTAAGANILLVEAGINSVTVGVRVAHVVGTALTLYERDRLTGYTSDGSPDGTVAFIVGAKITEFDA